MRKLLRSLFYITAGWLIATFDKEAGQELADLLDRDALDNYSRNKRRAFMPAFDIVPCTLFDGGIAGAHVAHTEQQWSFTASRFGRLVAVLLNQRDQEARILAVRIGNNFVFQCLKDGAPDWRDASTMLNQLGKGAQPGEQVFVYLDRKVSACRLCFELEPVEVERGVNEVPSVKVSKEGTKGWCPRCNRYTVDLLTWHKGGFLCSDCKNVVIKG